MSTLTLDNPHAVVAQLEQIERDLAYRQNAIEAAARSWYLAKREREREHAIEFMSSVGTVAERTERAKQRSCVIGMAEEAEYEAVKAAVGVLSTRASICQTLLKVQSR